jgi:8-oxo-dGTP diphosphatase
MLQQHRVEIAVGLIVADDGRVLLQHRDDTPGLQGRNQWGFFGGHVEPGERQTETFLREMQEELGWQPRHFEPYLVREIDRGEWQVRSYAFAAHLDVPLDALTLGEGQALALFAPNALPDAIVPDSRPVLAQFFASDAYKRVKRRWSMMTSTGLIVDRGGRLLLQHRDDKPEIANPGLWGSFGGAIEPYETPHEGFVRELDEELSWRPPAFELFGSYPYNNGEAGRQLIYAFAAALDVEPDALVLGEGQGLGLFAPDALPQDTVPDLRRLIAMFVASDVYRDIVSAVP